MDAPEVQPEAAESAPKKRRGPWPLIAVVIALTLLAIWLVPGESPLVPSDALDSAPPSLLDQKPAATQAEAPSEAVAIEQPVAAEPEVTETVDERPAVSARALIARQRAADGVTLDDLVTAAETAQAGGELADAYMLYFFAARAGHAGAGMALARQADPAHHEPGESVFEQPDLLQAHKWYQAAAQSGDSAAVAALDALRQRVERMAAGGDQEAQRIALMWQ